MAASPATVASASYADQRILGPLRRRPDGSFEAVSWETALAEVCARLQRVSDEHGDGSILCHDDVQPSGATCGTEVDAHIFGSRRRALPDLANSAVALVIGTGSEHPRGTSRTQDSLRRIAADPGRQLIALTSDHDGSAEIADLHLCPRPGSESLLLSALLGVLAWDELLDHDFLTSQATGARMVIEALQSVDVAARCWRAGVEEELVVAAARMIGGGESFATLEDRDESWLRIAHEDERLHLGMPELLGELTAA